MLLTITTTHEPATDLGFLLAKNPARVQSFPLTFGTAHVFYPEASEQRCTVALLLEVDPVGLVRGRRGPQERALEQYVNDRPYVASSFMSVAIGEVFGSALSGRSRDRPELAEADLPLVARLAALPCRGGEPVLRRLFEPLGYTLTAARHPLDESVPEWGESRYFDVELTGTLRLRDLLAHLTVLIPVLDDEKHYWVGDDEVEKLLRRGTGWLPGHPERSLIAERYLRHKHTLAGAAPARLIDEEPEESIEAQDDAEEVVERPLSLNEQRLGSVLAVLKGIGATRVLDLGCGEGRLLQALLREPRFVQITGMDV